MPHHRRHHSSAHPKAKAHWLTPGDWAYRQNPEGTWPSGSLPEVDKAFLVVHRLNPQDVDSYQSGPKTRTEFKAWEAGKWNPRHTPAQSRALLHKTAVAEFAAYRDATERDFKPKWFHPGPLNYGQQSTPPQTSGSETTFWLQTIGMLLVWLIVLCGVVAGVCWAISELSDQIADRQTIGKLDRERERLETATAAYHAKANSLNRESQKAIDKALQDVPRTGRY